MNLPIKNTFWLRSETDVPPRVLDSKLNEEEPQRHATNSHLNLNKLELFCFATEAARKPQAFRHRKRVWRTEGEYKMQAGTAVAGAFFVVNAREFPVSIQ